MTKTATVAAKDVKKLSEAVSVSPERLTAAGFRVRNQEFQDIPSEKLVAHPKNFRVHPNSQKDAIQKVLREVGFVGTLLVRRMSGGMFQILDGHCRQLQFAKGETVPCNVIDCDDSEAAEIIATYDRLTNMAEVDPDILRSLLDDCTFDVPGIDDICAEMLAEALAAIEGEGETSPPAAIIEDDVPDAPTATITQPGDLWLLGEHRLLCGDSTNAEQVSRLMGGNRASCVFTDPPYGVSVAKKNKMLQKFQPSDRNTTDIVDDDLTPEQLKARLLPAFENLRDHVMAEDCTLFVSAPQGGELGMMMMMMMQEAKLPTRHVLIWKKNQPTFSMGRLDYDYAHEPILLTWGKRHKRPMKGAHRTSVWSVDKPRKSEDHPTMKPVELYANAYLNNSDDGDNVADLYSGSGTAFIASQQVGRRCFGMEISPAYCDVIVKRWEKFTGKTAERSDQ